jgi:two-component system OmpR family response regulator
MKTNGILYAEDEIVRAKMDIDNFEKNGFVVFWAKNSQDAFKLYEKHAPDVAVLDIKLEDADDGGFIITKKIREIDPYIPILLLTSMDDEETVAKGYELGVTDFIRKRAGSREIIVRINKAIQLTPEKNNKDKIQITSETYLDVNNGVLVFCGNAVKLPLRELELLQCLLRFKNTWRKRADIQTYIWQRNENAKEYLDKTVCTLRLKLSRDNNIQLIARRNEGIMLYIKEI